MKRRLLSTIIALALCLSILPISAQAWVINGNKEYVYNGESRKVTNFQLTLDGVRVLESGKDFFITKYTDLDGNEIDCINVGPVLMHLYTEDSSIGALNSGQIRYDIVPAPLTITGLGGSHSKEYNGSADCDGTGLEIEFEGSFNNDDVAIKTIGGTYSYNSVNTGVGQEIVLSGASYELEGEKAGNYYITDNMPDTLTASVGTIRKAAALVPKNGDLVVTNGWEHTYTYRLDALLPEMEAGKSLGEEIGRAHV